MSASKRARRRAWRSRLRAIAREERDERRVVRALDVCRERERRGDASALRVGMAFELLSGSPRARVRNETPYRARIREAREARSRVTVLQGDRLAQRASQLAKLVPEVIDGVPVQSTARVAVIVETSNTVFAVESDRYPIAWVYDGDSIETYRRVVALRTKGGES